MIWVSELDWKELEVSGLCVVECDGGRGT